MEAEHVLKVNICKINQPDQGVLPGPSVHKRPRGGQVAARLLSPIAPVTHRRRTNPLGLPLPRKGFPEGRRQFNGLQNYIHIQILLDMRENGKKTLKPREVRIM